MKKLILLELCLLFLATTFQGDRLTGWVQQTIPRPDLAVVDLQFLDTLNGYILQLHPLPDTAFLSKTTDGGLNWSTTQFNNTYVTSIHFPDKNTGYIAARQSPDGVILKTTNSGENWSTVSVLTYASILRDIFFANRDTGWVSSRDLTSGGLWRTTNGGVNWQKQLNENYDPSKIFFVNSSTGWVIGNSGQNLYKTTNSGQNWFVQSSTSNENYYDVFFASPDTGWIVKSIGTGTYSMIKSTNGGDNWFGVNSPIVTTLGKLFFVSNTKGWIGDRYNRLLTTRDGNIWGKQSSPIYTNYKVFFTDSLHGWAGDYGLVHTTDGGGPIVSVNNQGTETPEGYVLYQNYPNPFNSISKIKYQISKITNVKIVIFDISGREISILINQRQSPGTYEYNFDAGSLSSGVYFYALFADGKRIDTKKMVLIK